jgi:two-component system, NarL family, response regulator
LIKVLFVDDHPMLRAGLAATINAEDDMTIAGEAGNGLEAVRLFAQLSPDVTLMDLRLPEMNGVDAIRAIREIDPQARIIVLTTYDGDQDIRRALEAGARAYLLKDMLRKELIDAIRAIHRGQRYLSPAAAARLAERVPGQDLSAREAEILRLVVKGMSNKEMAGELGLAEGTVRIHLSHIFEKLGVHDRTQAAVVALQRGFVHLE